MSDVRDNGEDSLRIVDLRLYKENRIKGAKVLDKLEGSIWCLAVNMRSI